MAKAAKIKPYHAHGCTECGQRYTDTCGDTATNGRCQSCRSSGKQDRPLWDCDFDPRPCCREASRRVRDVGEIERFTLAGPGPWWRCRTCSRTVPYDPTLR